MLQQMRTLSKSWLSTAFLLILAASFGVWGIADIFRGSNDTSVATVGGTKIEEPEFTHDLNTAKRNATRNGKHELSQVETQALGNKLLKEVIGETALDNAARELGILTTDNQVSSLIRSIPAFQGPDGTFSQLAFERVLQNNDYSEQSFVAEMRRELMREQLLRAAVTGLQLPPDYVRTIFSYYNERRAAEYVALPPDAVGAIAPPSDEVLAAFVKAHADRYSTPEFRELTFASIGPDDVASQVQVTDQQIRQTYDLRRDQYIIPERRDIQRINFPDEASAKAARAKIDTGAKFEDIAAQAKVSPADLELGSLAEADLGPVQGPAAFSLKEGEISQPVKGVLSGWSLLRVTKITAGKTTTLDMAKDAIKAELVKQLAGSRVEDVINAFDDARNSGADLSEAAKKVGMPITHVPTTDARGSAKDGTKAAVPANADFLDQVFKSDIGNEGDPFKASDGRYYVIKVEGVIPQKLKPLDAVRSEATAAWMEERRMRLLGTKASDIAKEVNAGQTLDQIAQRLHASVAKTDALMRDTPTSALNVDAIAKLFSVRGGKAVASPSADGKSYVVARVTGIFHIPLPLNDPRYRQFGQLLGNQLAGDMQESMAKAAQTAQGVKINQPQVDRILGGS